MSTLDMGMRGGGDRELMELLSIIAPFGGSTISLGLPTTCWEEEQGCCLMAGLPILGRELLG